jgi:hypothetical protein
LDDELDRMKLFRPTMTVSVEMGNDLAIGKGGILVDRCGYSLFWVCTCMQLRLKTAG